MTQSDCCSSGIFMAMTVLKCYFTSNKPSGWQGDHNVSYDGESYGALSIFMAIMMELVSIWFERPVLNLLKAHKERISLIKSCGNPRYPLGVGIPGVYLNHRQHIYPVPLFQSFLKGLFIIM